MLIVKKKGTEHWTRTAILLRLADAQSELKLEKRDHAITKKQMERQERQYEEHTAKWQDTLRTKIEELKNQYQIEKEHFKDKLQLTELKYKNLQLQYDELVAKSINTQPFENQLDLYLQEQANQNNILMSKFMDEITSLK